jgi:hypothetical protein
MKIRRHALCIPLVFGLFVPLTVFTHAQGTMQDLGTLRGSISVAYAINDSGQVVGSSYLEPLPVNDYVAFIWSQTPSARCENVTVSAGRNCTANASIDNGSSDPGGHPITLAQTPLGPYAIGTTVVTLTVTNSAGASSQCSGTVSVTDGTAPIFSIWGANPALLWPPNDKMSPIQVTATASDSCSQPVTCRISSIQSNEPADRQDDMVITGDLTANLRAERLGSGTGRIYRITVQCADGAGNSTTKDVFVTVPHDQGK